jgi:subtilisin family serine protease
VATRLYGGDDILTYPRLFVQSPSCTKSKHSIEVLVQSPSSYGADDADTSSTYRTTVRPNGFAPLDNVIAVASTTRYDKRSGFSNYGLKSVDLGALGSSIYSTLPNKKYGSYSGTSMATPHVTGTVALLWAYSPALGATDVKSRVLGSGDCNSELKGKTVTDRRLNALNALKEQGPACP